MILHNKHIMIFYCNIQFVSKYKLSHKTTMLNCNIFYTSPKIVLNNVKDTYYYIDNSCWLSGGNNDYDIKHFD